MPDIPPFRKSRISWFRCPFCSTATYSATSYTILSKKRPTVTVKYRCARCSKISTLRNAGLMHIGLPCAIAACTIAVAYSPRFRDIAWYSLSGIELLAVMMVGEIAISLAIARIARRFDPA